MHRCPGYALTDCPTNALLPDEPEGVDRCPICHAKNRKWETSLRIHGKPILKTSFNRDSDSAEVLAIMQRIAE